MCFYLKITSCPWGIFLDLQATVWDLLAEISQEVGDSPASAKLCLEVVDVLGLLHKGWNPPQSEVRNPAASTNLPVML